MLTPQDIKNKEFTKAVFGGYDMAVVDDFLETLVEDYNSLYKENAILKNKLKVLVEKVEEYRTTEDAMRMALLTAQKMSQDIINEATEKSESMIENAENTARAKIEELRIDIREEELRLDAARKKTADFVDSVSIACSNHLSFLSTLNDLRFNADPYPDLQAPVSTITRDEEIEETAIAIEGSLNKIFESNADKRDPQSDVDVVTADITENVQAAVELIEPLPSDDDEVDEPTSPRPKFNFTNLQFGANYENND